MPMRAQWGVDAKSARRRHHDMAQQVCSANVARHGPSKDYVEINVCLLSFRNTCNVALYILAGYTERPVFYFTIFLRLNCTG